MKKILLVATIGVAGIMSANNFTGKHSVSLKKEEKKEIKKSKKEAKQSKRRECRTAYVTCTAAYTCQDWTEAQWFYWGLQIQENYCMIDSPYTP